MTMTLSRRPFLSTSAAIGGGLALEFAFPISGMAQAAGLQFSPHTWSNGIGIMANLHLAAAVPNCPFIEFPYDPPAWPVETRDFVLTEPVRIDAGGYAVLPDKPGLGIELDEEQCRRYEVA